MNFIWIIINSYVINSYIYTTVVFNLMTLLSKNTNVIWFLS